jgi:hypothetical protein
MAPMERNTKDTDDISRPLTGAKIINRGNALDYIASLHFFPQTTSFR